MIVFNSFFSFAACELIVHPPCNEPGLLFNTRAVFSKALLKTAALFCPFVKLFLLFFRKKYPVPSFSTRYLSCHLILMTLAFSHLFFYFPELFQTVLVKFRSLRYARRQSLKEKCKINVNKLKVHIIKNTTKNNSSFCSQTAGDYRQFVH